MCLSAYLPPTPNNHIYTICIFILYGFIYAGLSLIVHFSTYGRFLISLKIQLQCHLPKEVPPIPPSESLNYKHPLLLTVASNVFSLVSLLFCH